MTPLEWSVLHAMQDMDRKGVWPSGDRLCERLADHPERDVRCARRDLVKRKAIRLSTKPDTAMPEPDPGADGWGYGRRDGTKPHGPGKRASDTEREFNRALWKVVHGHRGLYRQLSVLTGLSVNALKARVRRVKELGLVPDDDENYDEELTEDTLKYLAIRYGNEPAVREFLGSEAVCTRSHPDRTRFRGRKRAPNPV